MGERRVNLNFSREEYAKMKIDSIYLTNSSKHIYTACEDLNFHWDERDLNEIIKMWNQGVSCDFIAETYDRDVDEVAILIMDLARNKRIKPRMFGAKGRFGNRAGVAK